MISAQHRPEATGPTTLDEARAAAKAAVKTFIIENIDQLLDRMPHVALEQACAGGDIAATLDRIHDEARRTVGLSGEEIAARQYKDRLLRRAGGPMTLHEVRELLGHKTRQAVYKAAKERRLLYVTYDGKFIFPRGQFQNRAVLPAIAAIIAKAPNADGWAILAYLVDGDKGLSHDRPLDLIRGDAAQVERAVRFAETIES
jgi:hypothetical protein